MKTIRFFTLLLQAGLFTISVAVAQHHASALANASRNDWQSPADLAPNIVAGHNFDGLGQNSFGLGVSTTPPDPGFDI